MNKSFSILGVVLLCASGSFAQFCACPQNYDPVCATDGKTYPNSCELNCKRRSNSWLEQVQRGPCGKPDRPQPPTAPDFPCICPANYDPVCATDGKTYPNTCELNCKRRSNSWLEQVQRGPCGKPDRPQPPTAPDLPCICPANYQPVCGDNGKTYSNRCQLNCIRGISLAYHGSCKNRPLPPTEPDLPCICPANYQPVCGDNKKTYSNRCELNCVRGIRLAYHGSCKGNYNNY